MRSLQGRIWYLLISSLPSFLISILLDENNINNRNFILRRSTGYSTAICSVPFLQLCSLDSFFVSCSCETSSQSFISLGSSFCWLFYEFTSCVHSSLSLHSNNITKSICLPLFQVDYLEIKGACAQHSSTSLSGSHNWNSRSFLRTRPHAGNRRSRLFRVWLPSIIPSSWQVKNSGLMLYTVIVKKLLSDRVNDSSEKNLNIATFFIKYPFLRHWFSYKLDLVQSFSRSEPLVDQ